MRYFLELVLGRLVTHPEEVDLGRIIGRNGRTIEAIRSLLNAASRDGQRIFVEVEDGAHEGMAG